MSRLRSVVEHAVMRGPLPVAASLLIRRLQQVSKVVDGDLVIDRAELADAVRTTAKYQGVTCKLTIEPTTGNRVNDPDALARCAEG